MIVPDMYQPDRRQLTGDSEVTDIEVILPPEDGEEMPPEPTEDEKNEDMFYRNLADDLDPQELMSLAEEVADMYDNDLKSRADWTRMYEEGIELLGLGIEERTEPFDGACGVVHPLMAEAAVRFQSEAITETFSPQGICKSMIVGKFDELRQKAAKRVENDINWRLTTQMREYRPEHERMLWNLAIMGSAFKKVYYDPGLGRQTSVFVSAEDLVVPYGATDISTAPRISHLMRKSKNDIKKLQVAGFYRDIELEDPIQSTSKSAKDRITGVVAIKDDRLQLVEMQIDLDLKGFEDIDADGEQTGIAVPYIVTFDLQSREILSVYRNWSHTDQYKTRLQHFVHYVYVPGFGFYGMGLVHLVGGFASSATSLLRQLVDAGTLANLPAGFKTKGIRVQRDADPLQPGEFRDVDVPSGSLKDNLIPLPFKEPSQTLVTLFNEVVDEGRRMAAVSDVNAADMNQQAPVGTTLAILERSMKVMTAIQARLHASLKEELTLLKNIIQDQLPDGYDYEVDEGRRIKQSDYDIADIIPVSDPNAATMSQRVVQYQAVIQMAKDNPAIYDMVELNRQMLETLGIKNIAKLIPASVEQSPKDPISENMAIMTGKPVKAFAYQDHEAHLRVHYAAQQDPKIRATLGQMPNGQAIMAAGAAHIAEHVAFAYRMQVEQQLGVPLPQGDEKMSPETERQLSVVLAQAAAQVLQARQTEAAQQQAQQAAQDPVLQQQMQQMQVDMEKTRIAEKKVDNDFKVAVQRLLVDAGKADAAGQAALIKQVLAMVGDAAKADVQGQGGQADAGMQQAQMMQQMQQKEQTHTQNMAHQRQTHEQKLRHAEQQQMLNAALAAAQPHLGGGTE